MWLHFDRYTAAIDCYTCYELCFWLPCVVVNCVSAAIYGWYGLRFWQLSLLWTEINSHRFYGPGFQRLSFLWLEIFDSYCLLPSHQVSNLLYTMSVSVWTSEITSWIQITEKRQSKKRFPIWVLVSWFRCHDKILSILPFSSLPVCFFQLILLARHFHFRFEKTSVSFSTSIADYLLYTKTNAIAFWKPIQLASFSVYYTIA
jgi:hypothetical protein